MTQFARKAAADYAESVVVAVTKAVERGMVVTLTTELDDLQKQFVERFTGSKIGQEQVAKSDEQQMVWGWASVSTLDGQLITDAQGDECDVIELQKAAHEFMQSSRVGKVMHAGRRKGYIADSIVFTKALQDALGIDLGMEGWFVGYKVEDPDTWARVKKGELRAFSIGGLGNREALSKFNPNHDAKGRFGSGGGSGGGGAAGGAGGGGGLPNKKAEQMVSRLGGDPGDPDHVEAVRSGYAAGGKIKSRDELENLDPKVSGDHSATSAMHFNAAQRGFLDSRKKVGSQFSARRTAKPLGQIKATPAKRAELHRTARGLSRTANTSDDVGDHRAAYKGHDEAYRVHPKRSTEARYHSEMASFHAKQIALLERPGGHLDKFPAK